MSESPVFGGTLGAKITGSLTTCGVGEAGAAKEASLTGDVAFFGKTKDPG